MAGLKKGRWALFSDGNPDTLARFFRGCREQGCETQGVVLNCPEGKFDWPANWKAHKSGPIQKPGDEWIGILWADMCPQAPKWDVTLINAVAPWNVVTSQECHVGDWRLGAICWGADLYEAGGGFPFFGDIPQAFSNWAKAAIASRAWYIEKVVLPRKHPPTFAQPEVSENFTEKLQACMSRHGVRICEPDYKGVSLQISTPSISRPAIEYMMSLMNTQRDLMNAGAAVEWALERWNADIGMARAHILSEFMQTKHTHLLLIDDDMSWDSPAVHRLFWANKDIVAIAGPKKSYPLRFAASKVDERGHPVPLQLDNESGCCEVDHVGAAFMLLKREAVQKMIDAYPELQYTGVDGKPSWAFYLQQVKNDRYMPEDFSFCERWRAIGGKLYICPDVPLGHVGQHIYQGSLLKDMGRPGL